MRHTRPVKAFVIAALLAALLVVAIPSRCAQAIELPIECANGFTTIQCVGALVLQWVLGGPLSGDWDVGGHNWDW